ncbi:MAG TPA: hypothetical protein PLZ86_05860 [bacterium]|nr:hypothetical protein [bacterium]
MESTGSRRKKGKGGFSQMLDRLLPKVEMGRTDRLLEIVAAALMALATMGSAWSAYQATTWSGVQTFRLNEANAARALATRYWNEDTQFVAFDATMLIDYLSAETSGNRHLADLLRQRFRPDFHDAVEAWLALDPFNNPVAPRSPFVMDEYKSTLKDKALGYEKLASQKTLEGSKANRIGDNYVLLTVLFASVLFFAGICVKFKSRRVKAVMLFIGLIAFASTAIVLTTFPVTGSGVSVAKIP